ncbi:DinB family protein [Microlunatus panaciterrae]|uniref:Damage-inducible protein DinB n=1 Tax=Microlunatus panaciterrae TaxID=400768 RepID=A0ABS2RDK6_9ACTN|nr:DinB family protein [Microlunatus panaciterrae]MBM7797085.1 putative damage-inducible protein DinB [Microlunatus panaciterrae]
MSDMDLTDLRGTEFVGADLAGARFTTVNLDGATFRACGLGHVVMRGVEILDATIDGEIQGLVINGVDVTPLVEAELDRRHPDRPKFRPTTPEGFRQAWDLNEQLWESTVTRAGRLPVELLHESVDGEWSFIQTLRHLAFATESWVGRAVLGDPHPWHPLSLPWDQMRPRPGVPNDRDARPSLEEALALRHEAMALMRGVVDHLTEAQLDNRTEPLVGPGWPDEGDTFLVRECLLVVLNEEWCHRMYAERDLAVLETRN